MDCTHTPRYLKCHKCKQYADEYYGKVLDNGWFICNDCFEPDYAKEG